MERREGWVDGCVCGGGVHCDRWGAKEGHSYIVIYTQVGGAHEDSGLHTIWSKYHK